MRHTLPLRSLPSPSQDALVSCSLGFVEFGQQAIVGSICLHHRCRVWRRSTRCAGDVRAGQHPGFQVHRPEGTAPLHEELWLRPQYLPIRQVCSQCRIIEHARGRVPAYRQNSCFYHHLPSHPSSRPNRDQGSALDPASRCSRLSEPSMGSSKTSFVCFALSIACFRPSSACPRLVGEQSLGLAKASCHPSQ